MKNTFKVIEVPNAGRSGWGLGAYCLTFVYSPKGNFLVKGYYAESNVFIEGHFDRYFYRRVMYRKGTSRTTFSFSDACSLRIKSPRLKKSGYCNRFVVQPYTYEENQNAIKLQFKRFPTKWITEFDYLIDKYCTKSDKKGSNNAIRDSFLY
jgi:hypothetical protein